MVINSYKNIYTIKKLMKIKALWARVARVDKNQNSMYTYAKSPFIWSTHEWEMMIEVV